jgi:hypothetical protein
MNNESIKVLWRLFNQPLIVAALLALIPFIYTNYQNHLSNKEEVSNLLVEIEARLSKLDVSRNANRLNTTSMFDNLAYVILMPPGADRAIMDCYANRNLRSLFYELNVRSGKYSEERIVIDDLHEEYQGIKHYIDKHNAFADSIEEVYASLFRKSLHEPQKTKP